ncbi:hypothetical protein CRUP_008699, partial [Coryphaenoides rupestris]
TPNFIKSPEDQIGISGGVASFVCQASGEPKPRITWMKKGKKVSSQRFESHAAQRRLARPGPAQHRANEGVKEAVVNTIICLGRY